MNDEIYNQVSQFLDEYKIFLDKDMTRETRIQDDFGITGDEAAEFLDAFVKQFHIKDYSEFIFDDYFEPEGLSIFSSFIGWSSKKKLTIGDLERAIETGILK